MASVFISYNSEDRGFVEQLVRDLRANGVEPWYDRWEMVPGDSLTRKIGDAILDNDYLVAVLSPNSVRSEWVQGELAVALNREFRDRAVQVVPALLKDCSVPAFLQDKVYADFREDYRRGLGEVLSAVGRTKVGAQVVTSLPAAQGSRLHWDNVIGTNLSAGNVVDEPTR